MAYTVVNKSSSFMNRLNYDGTSATHAVTGLGFQPDLCWFKRIDSSAGPSLIDSVRGVTKRLNVTNYDGEGTVSDMFVSFDSDGYTLGADSSNYINYSAGTYTSWNFKAGTTSGIATNGSTTITPTAYSFNQTIGFSIIKYTGNGTSGAKLAHGLGVAPEYAFFKRLEVGGDNWIAPSTALESNWDFFLHNNLASGYTDSSSEFADTAPDAVNLTLGNAATVNVNTSQYLAYCWTGIKGFSRFSKYKGDGQNDGSFVFTGFRPSLLITKRYNTSQNWRMYISSGFNNYQGMIHENLDNAQSVDNRCDFLANGFKWKDNSADHNADGATYIYGAWGQPLVSTSGKPGTAN